MKSRATRRFLAWLMAVCVLFAQSAALAYGCSLDRAGGAPEATTAPCPSHVADADSWGDVGQGNLCQVHCQTPTTADPGASVPLLGAVDARSEGIAAVRWSVYRVPTLLPPRSAPPAVLQRTSRLLI